MLEFFLNTGVGHLLSLVLCSAGYVVVGYGVNALIKAVFKPSQYDATPFMGGIFWPAAIPLITAILFTMGVIYLIRIPIRRYKAAKRYKKANGGKSWRVVK